MTVDRSRPEPAARGESGVSSFTGEHGTRSEIHLEIEMEDAAVGADRHRIRRVADRAVLDVDELTVQSKASLLREVPTLTNPHFGRLAEVAENL